MSVSIATDWSSGYIVDVAYTQGYYRELNPQRIELALLAAGLAAPAIQSACELGFGHGLSVNIHAASSVRTWWGTDFNPVQAGLARELASVSGADAKLYDDSFADFCSRDELPDFDYIGLHGIWSWISKENCSLIIDFIRRKLKVGGVLYISYNAMPGWAGIAPLRHLLTEHAEVMAVPGRGTISRIDAALAFAEKLLATNPLYVRAHPGVVQKLQGIKGQNRNYVAHEYLCRDWHPMPFADMAQWLSSSKLSYACSAHYLDHVDTVNLTPDQQAFLKEIPDAMFRETVRDFMVNQQFRRDYWVKGARKLSGLEQVELLRKQRLMLTLDRSEVTLKATGALGEATLQDAVYGPILDTLADHQPKTLHRIEEQVRDKRITFPQVLQAMMVLTGNGALQAAQDETMARKAKATADRLNAHLMDKARGSSDINYLASPVTGGGVIVSRFGQLFLLARAQGRKQPQEWAAHAWQTIAAQGQRLIKDGKTLESADENVAELTRQAKSFAEKQLPVLKALMIA